MAWKCMLTVLSVFAAMTVYGDLSAEDDAQAFVDSINKKQSMWTAKKRDITDLKNQLLQNQLGLDTHEHAPVDPSVHVAEVRGNNMNLPSHYDASEDFPECNIRRVKHQYECGCCWAVSSAAVMQDRLCMHSQGRIKVNISAAYLVGCCDSCSPGNCGAGSAIIAFAYMMRHGVVTGGEYQSNDGCYPYPLCEYCNRPAKGFACPESCPNQYYDKDINDDKYYVSEVRAVNKGGAAAIQQELFRNGPVVVSVLVHDDFMYYSGGIYQYTEGNFIAGHYVRLIGYGTENGVDYWIGVNSWASWGEGGSFRIRRGVNESGIEAGAQGPIPDISQY